MKAPTQPCAPPTFHPRPSTLLLQEINEMMMYRYAWFALLGLLHVAALANWTPSNLTSTGHKSMTTHNGALYLATFNTGVQKSVDNGVSWTLVNSGLPLTEGTIKVQSVGSNGTTLFCGTESGIYRSTNHGASWSIANGTLTANASTYVNKIYNFNGVLFVVFSGMSSNSNGGVFRTVDNGTTWLSAYNGLSTNMTIYNIDMMDGVLYASTNTALMKSADLGQSWSQVGTTNYAVYAVQGIGGRIVALTTFGARYSIDNGVTWVNSTNYPVASPPAGSELLAYDSKFYAITRSGPIGCYRSSDGGETWEVFNTGLSAPNTFVQEEFHSSGSTLFIICALDVYSTPGSTVGLPEQEVAVTPKPYPTVFTEGFKIDLSNSEPGSTVILVDATGREVMRFGNLALGVVPFERNGLAAGTYQCFLADHRGDRLHLGQVVAQ
jgi:hypothetical protein